MTPIALIAFILLAPVDAPVTSIAFAPDGKQALVGSQNGVAIRSWPALSVERRLATTLVQIHDLRFSPDGKRIVVAGGDPGQNGLIELWSWPAAEKLKVARVHEDVIYQVAWRADGQQLACASADERVGLVEVPTLNVQAKLAGHSRGITAVTYLRGGELLVTAGLDESIRVWELERSQVVRSLTNHTAAVRDVASFHAADPSQPVLASCGADFTVRLWQPLTGRLIRFVKLSSEPLDLEWSVDGKRLIVACKDGHLRVLSSSDLAVVLDSASIDGWAYALSFAPDGESALIGGSGGQIHRVMLAK